MGAEQTSKERNKQFVKAVLEVGPVQKLVDAGKPLPVYRRFLNRSLPAKLKFRGVYRDFSEASDSAPRDVPAGYDHEQLGRIYDGYLQGPMESDYPVLFWLKELLSHDLVRLFDFGGNTGFSFYAWSKHLNYDKVRDWKVCDLPSIVQAGRQLAGERGEPRLTFTSAFEDCDGSDILLSAGCVQYVEDPIAKMISKLPAKPTHLIFNRVPLNAQHACVTVQNIGRMAAAYHVFHRDSFVRSLEEVGYELIDHWTNSDHQCWIPFYPEHSVAAYSGLYFRRRRP